MEQLVREVDAELLETSLVLRPDEGSGSAEVDRGRLCQTLRLEARLVEEDDLGRGRGILRAGCNLVVSRLGDECEQDSVEVLRELVALSSALLSIHHDGVQLLPHIARLVRQHFAQLLWRNA